MLRISWTNLFEDERIDGFLDVGRYDRFMADICVFKRQTIDFLKTCKSENKAVFGLGAPVQGNTLLNFFEIDQTMVECLVEINDLRENKRAPGSNIPVVLEDSLARTPDVYFVLAWNFKNEILRRYKDLIDQGIEFYFFPLIQHANLGALYFSGYGTGLALGQHIRKVGFWTS